MSRRESRSSIGARQNDALFEFENFKKKFLLANKHITKLNSTLSVRIEELNAQISLLSVENLRLRASEIALAAQLKREREKSERIIADAEAASQSLVKHLSYLRASYDIKHTPVSHTIPTSPRARRREPSVDPESGSPLFNRIARPPNVPGIHEEEEPSSDEQHYQVSHTGKKIKTKPRLSASKLPLPTRSTSPTRSVTPLIGHHDTEHISAGSHLSKPRKTLRRPSGLLEINTEALSVPRSASPAFGSPIRLEAGRAEAEEYAAIRGEIEVVIIDQNQDSEGLVKKEKRKGKTKESPETGSEKDGSVDVRPREKKKHRDEVEPSDLVKPKSRDSSVVRTALQPIDSNVHDLADVEPAKNPSRQFLRPSSPAGSAPTSRGSSSPVPPDADGPGGTGNRERRTRKSVNYAEPKLNTKMRKPDPPPGGAEPPVRKKRSSAAAVMTSTLYKPTTSSSPNAMDNDTDIEPRSSLEAPSLPPTQTLPNLPLRGANGYINPETFPIPLPRPGSAAAMYSPGPPTRTTGSTTSGTSTASSSSSSATTLKKKKSRPLLSDDDSDGGEADAEYMGGGGGASGAGSWVNVEGRRKALPKRSAATAAVAAIEDIRRHSMAI